MPLSSFVRGRRLLGSALLSASLVVPLVGLTPTAAVAATAAPDPVVASGDDWSVSRVAGGYLVVVDLARPLPIRSDAPTVVVDGETVGIATEAADGRSLSVFTADPAVTRASDAEAGWASQTTSGRAAPTAAVDVPEVDAAPPLETDPTTPGAYDWTESVYAFGDQAIPLAAIVGIRGELEGKVYLPTTGGARPTVVLLHGRHTSCYGSGTANPNRWPCPVSPDLTDRKSIPSYAGYDGTARALASRGYAVVSISANAINSNDNQLAADQGAQARGQLILDTLTMLDRANRAQPVSYYDAWQNRTLTLDQAFDNGTTSYNSRADGFVNGAPPLDDVGAADLVGRFDLSTIGLMGHSRGGEGVTSAATLNQGLDQPWAIESILPLAPVDFARATVPDVPMNVVLPYCDGDVSNQQGQHMLDDSRYAFGDDVLRSGTWVMGANHNFFNTVWTPGQYAFSTSDDWSGTSITSARATEPICGTAPSTSATSIRMTAAEQYALGTSYMTAWFRLTLGGEQAFLPMFDGTGAVPAALNGEDVRTVATAPSSARSTIATFERSASLVRTFGTAVANPCASLSGRTVPQDLAPCAATLGSAQAPHWTPASNGGNVPATPMTRMVWTDGTGQVRVSVPPAKRNASGFDRLSVKLAADETVATGTDLTMTVVDGAGATWSSKVSALNPLALVRFPTSTSSAATTTLKKVVLQQVNVPVADLTAAGLNASDLREVRFIAAVGADGVATGAAYLSDLAFEDSSVGTAQRRTWPTIDVFAPTADEGDAPGTVDVAVYLAEPATSPVTGYVSYLGSSTSRAGAAMEPVTFAPGETCKVVTAAAQGDDLASTSNSSVLKASVINTSGVVAGKQSVVYATIREDDGTLPSGSTPAPAELPAVGTPGPVCGELAAYLVGGDVTTAANATPGTDTPVSAGGFRPGESVTFAVPGAPGVTPVAALADPSGTASAVLTLPAGLTPGPTPVTATGAGTGRVADGTIPVRAATTTALAIAPAAPTLRESVTLTATVTGAEGTVEFFDGATSLGTAATSGGVATLVVPGGFGAGDHSLTAALQQTALAAGSTSAPVAFMLAPRASTAALSFTPASPVFGTPVTVQIAVSGASEGTVELSYGSATAELPVDEDGLASLTLDRTLPAGSYTFDARFTGTDDVAPSQTTNATLTIARKSTTTTVLAPASVAGGSRPTVRVRVGDVVAGAPATGPVVLTVVANGTRTLTRRLTASSGSVVAIPVKVGNVDRVRLTARYGGGGSYLASTSETVVMRVR